MTSENIPVALFKLGRLVTTPNAQDTLPQEEVFRAIQRHQAGDWGEMEPEDRVANDRAMVDGSRIFSRYVTTAGITFWIITEADRSFTTVLLPEDY